MAGGALHFFEGWVIFVACAALLAAEVYVLSLSSQKSFLDVFHFPKIAVSCPKSARPEIGGQ